MATTKATTLAHTIASTTSSTADLNYAKTLNDTGVTATEFDKLDGLTATTTELNKLNGVTATADEINLVDGSVTGPLSHRNMVINGEMLVDQRGTTSSAVTGSTYKIDRFIDFYGNGPVHSVQRVTETPTNLSDFFKYSMKIKQTTASGSATPDADDYNFLQYTVEGQDCSYLKLGTAHARTFTLSFYVKSTVAGIYSVGINNGAYNRSFSKKYTISSANTWERISLTFTGDTTGTWATDNTVGLSIRWNLGGGTDRTQAEGSWGTGFQDGADGSTGANTFSNTVNAEFHITGIQLELGSVATPFEHKSYAEELARCQRYFISYGLNETGNAVSNAPTTFRSTTADGSNTISGYQCFANVDFPVQLRTPSISFTALASFNGSGTNLSNVDFRPFVSTTANAQRLCIQKGNSNAPMGTNQTIIGLCFNVSAEF